MRLPPFSSDDKEFPVLLHYIAQLPYSHTQSYEQTHMYTHSLSLAFALCSLAGQYDLLQEEHYIFYRYTTQLLYFPQPWTILENVSCNTNHYIVSNFTWNVKFLS